MKKIILFLFLVPVVSEIEAQCNNPYYQIKEGTLFISENYNDKDKLQGRTESEVIEYAESSNGFSATFATKIYDKKGELVTEGKYSLSCNDGTITMDMTGMVPAESMAAFKDMEMEITMNELEYPAGLTVGQVLNDASIEISASGSIPMKLVFNITDRKVAGKETVTTPAGTFDCYKITYNSDSKMMIAKMNFTNVEYLSEQSGVVKTETYRSNGKLMGYTIITKYEF